MRLSCCLLLIFAVCLGTTSAAAQNEATQRTEQLEPYHKHQDTRYGHNRYYPDRGAIIRDIPKDATLINYAGLALRFHEGVWFEPRGPAYMVTAPPIGVIVSALPTFATVLAQKGQTLLYCNDAYYQPRPDLGGFQVVNDPSEPNAPEGNAREPNAREPNTPDPNTPDSAQKGAATAPAVSADSSNEGDNDSPLTGIPAPAAQALPVHPNAAAGKQAPPAPAAGARPPDTPQPIAANPMRTLLYPRNGQSSDQQAKDRYDCYRFAVAQTGFDPMKSSSAAQASALQADYLRAQGACLDAHGYTVR